MLTDDSVPSYPLARKLHLDVEHTIETLRKENSYNGLFGGLSKMIDGKIKQKMITAFQALLARLNISATKHVTS